VATVGASIVPVSLTVNGRTGLTLWAPPWEDDDGEEWQGFLGDGAKILLFPGTRELADFIASGEENDLSDHPGWGRVLKLTPDRLRPGADDGYDLDRVYEWAAGDPDPVRRSALADVVDMVGKIADCCDDGALRRLVVGTPEYADLVDEDTSYHGRDGRRAWSALGDVIAETWERAISRVQSWLSWCGEWPDIDDQPEDGDDDSVWAKVGAAPVELVLPSGRFVTLRAVTDDGAVFPGDPGSNALIFTEPAALAAHCRADAGALTDLPGWDTLADADPAGDEELFTPDPETVIDLTEPSEPAAELLAQLAEHCGLDIDPPSANASQRAWRKTLNRIETHLEEGD